MKKTIFSSVVFLSLSAAYGQNLAKESSKPVTEQAPVVSKEMETYAVKNGTYIIARPEGKKLSPAGEVTLEKAKLVDPKAIGVKIMDRTQYFTIAGTNDLLVVKSSWVLDNEMKNSKK